jgi:hypothetical protein
MSGDCRLQLQAPANLHGLSPTERSVLSSDFQNHSDSEGPRSAIDGGNRRFRRACGVTIYCTPYSLSGARSDLDGHGLHGFHGAEWWHMVWSTAPNGGRWNETRRPTSTAATNCTGRSHRVPPGATGCHRVPSYGRSLVFPGKMSGYTRNAPVCGCPATAVRSRSDQKQSEMCNRTGCPNAKNRRSAA